MTLRLGDTAPDFVQDSTEGTIHFHEGAGMVAERFPKGFQAVKPYLRLTPQPNK